MRALEATGMEVAIVEKLEVFTHRGAGEGLFQTSRVGGMRQRIGVERTASSESGPLLSSSWRGKGRPQGLRGLASPGTRSSSGL